MIVELIVKALTSVVEAIIGMLPNGGVPAFVGDGAFYLDQVLSAAAGLGGWIPWTLAGQVFASVMACVVIGFGIRVVRIVASLLTGGGGS